MPRGLIKRLRAKSCSRLGVPVVNRPNILDRGILGPPEVRGNGDPLLAPVRMKSGGEFHSYIRNPRRDGQNGDLPGKNQARLMNALGYLGMAPDASLEILQDTYSPGWSENSERCALQGKRLPQPGFRTTNCARCDLRAF